MTDRLKSEDNAVQQQLWQLATAVRDSCFAAAVQAYEDARMDGLCHEGAWECAVDTMRAIDFEGVFKEAITKL